MGVSDKIGSVLLYGVRHANVAEDKKGTIRGTLNPSIDEKGEKQRDELGEFFEDIALSGIATDDLARTQETVLPIAEAKNLELQVDIDLRSWDVGPELEKKSIETHKQEIIRLKTQPWMVPIGGQSWGEYEGQALTGFYRYLHKGMDSAFPWLIGIHGSLIQVVAVELKFVEKKYEYDATPMEPSGVFAVYLTRQGLMMKILRGEKDVRDE
jgi:broad specificity phosphatase PhoE